MRFRGATRSEQRRAGESLAVGAGVDGAKLQQGSEGTRGSCSSDAEQLKRRLRDFWNSQQCYWDITSSGQCVESPAREHAASFLPPGESVLDVACGTAANSEWLRNRCRYFGVDVSVLALQQPIHPSLDLTCADADCLPFQQETFGAVIATYVLEHSVEPTKMLQEMCRVAKRGGRIVLLGPSWDYPFWFPNSVRVNARDRWWRVRYAIGRFGAQLMGWWFGRLPFERVNEPDAFHSQFTYDADAVYIVWSYEVIRLMRRWGHRLVHWEVDDRLLGTNPGARAIKRLLCNLPIYRYAGSTVLLVFEK